jgi:hypothetical protein
MELLVATWSVRLAAVAALAVAVASIASGIPVSEAILRAIAAAFVFTLGGRILLTRLESKEQRFRRLMAQRAREGGAE